MANNELKTALNFQGKDNELCIRSLKTESLGFWQQFEVNYRLLNDNLTQRKIGNSNEQWKYWKDSNCSHVCHRFDFGINRSIDASASNSSVKCRIKIKTDWQPISRRNFWICSRVYLSLLRPILQTSEQLIKDVNESTVEPTSELKNRGIARHCLSHCILIWLIVWTTRRFAYEWLICS